MKHFCKKTRRGGKYYLEIYHWVTNVEFDISSPSQFLMGHFCIAAYTCWPSRTFSWYPPFLNSADYSNDIFQSRFCLLPCGGMSTNGSIVHPPDSRYVERNHALKDNWQVNTTVLWEKLITLLFLPPQTPRSFPWQRIRGSMQRSSQQITWPMARTCSV